jgi:hypothetical protein
LFDCFKPIFFFSCGKIHYIIFIFSVPALFLISIWRRIPLDSRWDESIGIIFFLVTSWTVNWSSAFLRDPYPDIYVIMFIISHISFPLFFFWNKDYFSYLLSFIFSVGIIGTIFIHIIVRGINYRSWNYYRTLIHLQYIPIHY